MKIFFSKPMYQDFFYITTSVGNNALSFDERKNRKLFVPSIKKISDYTDIMLTDEITFEDFGFDGTLQTCHGLQNLYEIDWQGKKIYLVDNHNHVFYFWYLARHHGIINDNSLLYHIDEHADTRDPGKYLLKPDSEDLHKVFAYTNFFLNVGNYIVPAEREGIIGETIQIRSESALESYESGEYEGKEQERNIVLNLDLDFFSPGLDYIDYNLKKNVILDIAQKADVITVCTSPFFIDQQRAIKVFQDIFS